MNTQYDPRILQEFSDRLYSQAKSVIVLCVIVGVIIGLIIGAAVADVTVAIVLALVLGALGYAIGLSIGFQLKLRAQVLLCQKQIEENTRKAVPVSNPTNKAVSVPQQSATAQSSPTQKYFFSVGEKNLGPYSLEEMRQLRKNGKLPDETLVFREGDKDWHPATMFPEIIF